MYAAIVQRLNLSRTNSPKCGGHLKRNVYFLNSWCKHTMSFFTSATAQQTQVVHCKNETRQRPSPRGAPHRFILRTRPVQRTAVGIHRPPPSRQPFIVFSLIIRFVLPAQNLISGGWCQSYHPWWLPSSPCFTFTLFSLLNKFLIFSLLTTRIIVPVSIIPVHSFRLMLNIRLPIHLSWTHARSPVTSWKIAWHQCIPHRVVSSCPTWS